MCFKVMTHPVPQPATPYVVAKPQVSDAVGCALRDAFNGQPMPEDMLKLLARLDDQNRVCSRG